MIDSARHPRSRPRAAHGFVERLRAQGTRYHNLHPFHVRMDAGELTRDELQRWVANRFYYQECIPLKDAAILSNCPEVAVRREWIQRIVDHDGTADGHRRDRVVAAPRRGARGDARGARLRAARAPGRALRRRRLRELRAPAAVDRGRGVIAHGAVRPGRDPGTARGARAPLPVDRPRRPPVLPRPARARRRATRTTRSVSSSSAAAPASSRMPPWRRCKFKTEVLWAQLDAIERGDTQPQAARVNRPRLVDGARLQYDDVREEHLLLIPEGAVRLNATAAQVLELCDGERSRRGDRRRALGALRGRRRRRRRARAARRDGASGDWWSMPAPRPYTLVAELTYQCPLHCPYCSNPVDIGGDRWRAQLETEHWTRVFREARALGVAPARPDRRRADAPPRPRRARRRRPRGRAVLDARDRRHALHARARRAAEGGGPRPRPGLDPEPRSRGERPDRRHPLVRQEDRGRARRARARLPAHDQLRPAPPEPRPDRGDPRAHRGARRPAARAREHAVLRVGGRERAGAHPDARAARARRGGGAALPRARRPADHRPLGAPGHLRGPAEAVHGRLGADDDGDRAQRRGAPLPGRGDDPRPRVPQREGPLARVDLERVGRVHALPRHGLDAGAVPLLPARSPGGGLGRLPLPGAPPHRRRRGHRSRLPVLTAPRDRRRGPRSGADRRVRLPHDEAPAGRGARSRFPGRAARQARCGGTRARPRASCCR